MSIVITPHGERLRDKVGSLVDALPGQTGPRVAVGAGSISGALAKGLYRIKATAACRVMIGAAAAGDASNGEPWDAGEVETRFVDEGQKIAVAAA